MDKLLEIYTSDKSELKKKIMNCLNDLDVFNLDKNDMMRILVNLCNTTDENDILKIYKELCIVYLATNVDEITNSNLSIVKQLLSNCQTDQSKISKIQALGLETIKMLINKLYNDLHENIKKQGENKIAELYKRAKEEIPQYFEDVGSVHLNGKYGNIGVDLRIEPSHPHSLMYLSLAEMLSLTNIIDQTKKIDYISQEGPKQTFGVIYIIDITICDKKEYTIPIQINIIDDSDTKNYLAKICNTRSIILGNDFITAHEAVLNSKDKTLTLNGNIILNYHSEITQ